MIKIGITGGIGSGKTVISALLTVYSVPVYSADDAGKRLSDESAVIKSKLTTLFGKEIYIGGRLDRVKLASFVFNNAKLLEKVNNIIHPIIRKDFKNWVKAQDSKLCAIESAILFESGFSKEVDITLMVYAPVELRYARVMKRDSITEVEVMKRMSQQLPDTLKRKKTDYVITNDDVQSLIRQVETFLNIIKKK